MAHSVLGLPEIELLLPDRKTMFTFNTTDYFIYPIRNIDTEATHAMYGLELFDFDTNQTLNPTEDYYFGMLLA